MKTRFWLGFALAALIAAPLSAGCSSDVGEENENDQGAVSQRTPYRIDFEAYNRIYGTSFRTPEEAYSVLVKVGDKAIPAPTHLFGQSVNIIPYSNDDGTRTATGDVLARGDSIIAQVYKPGELGIAVKHHRSEVPVLDLSAADPGSLKEHFKLQDTHIEIVVGVKRDGKNGAVTINNPQSYEDGYFGDEEYAMVFLKPVYPSYLSANQKQAFEANVRTMLLAFNAVTDFPAEYNGGDPLGARNPERVREYVKNMVLALNGDQAAQTWFRKPANQVYCAELAFLAFSAGLIVPLNDEQMIPLVGEAEWRKFQDAIAKHNAGEPSPFTTMNSNQRVSLVRDLTVAPAGLKPAPSYGPLGDANKLALEPMTASDIIEDFMRMHLPREKFGEALAPAQAGLLAAMKPGLLEQMRMNDLPEGDPRRAAVDRLYDALVEAVGRQYGSYAEFRAAVEPLLAQARQVSGPRGDSGEGLFVPPSLFHVAAQGKRAGLMSFQYEGHGVHVSAVTRSNRPAAKPTAVNEIASAVSCGGHCGGLAPGGCFCDARCASDSTGCCADVATVCR